MLEEVAEVDRARGNDLAGNSVVNRLVALAGGLHRATLLRTRGSGINSLSVMLAYMRGELSVWPAESHRGSTA